MAKMSDKTIMLYKDNNMHSQKRIMKPFAFTKPHDFRVFTKEYN